MCENKSTYDMLVYQLASNAEVSQKDIELRRWMHEVILSNEFGFDFGLVGMGWLVAYLVQINYIDADQDEIVEDLDDNIYKLSLKAVATEKVSIRELLHLCTYYQQRLIYESNAHFYRRFPLFECIKLLIDKLSMFLKGEVNMHAPSLLYNTDILLKFSFLSKTCVSDSIYEDSFYPAFESSIEILRRQKPYDLTTLYKLGIAAKQYDHPYWVDCIQRIINMAIEDNHQKTDSSEIWKQVYQLYPLPLISFFDDFEYWSSERRKKNMFEILTNIHYSEQKRGAEINLIYKYS